MLFFCAISRKESLTDLPMGDSELRSFSSTASNILTAHNFYMCKLFLEMSKDFFFPSYVNQFSSSEYLKI